jgi:DNA-binding transcriptional MerR regulator
LLSIIESITIHDKVRISELSGRSGVPIPTIKYYLREELLPAGRHTARNQAEYDDSHLRRLRLIRVLGEVGELPIAAIRQVVMAVDDESLPFHDMLGVAQRALAGDVDRDAIPERREIDSFLSELGWRVSRDSPARDQLAAVMSSLRALGWDVSARSLRPYARAASALAEREVKIVDPTISKVDAIERLVIGTVAFEKAFAALRRLSHEHHSALRFGSGRRFA